MTRAVFEVVVGDKRINRFLNKCDLGVLSGEKRQIVVNYAPGEVVTAERARAAFERLATMTESDSSVEHVFLRWSLLRIESWNAEEEVAP